MLRKKLLFHLQTQIYLERQFELSTFFQSDIYLKVKNEMLISRLQLLESVFEMLRKVNLFEPALVVVVEDQGLVDDPELFEKSGNLNQNDDGVLLDVLDEVLQEDGRLAGLTLNLESILKLVFIHKTNINKKNN